MENQTFKRPSNEVIVIYSQEDILFLTINHILHHPVTVILFFFRMMYVSCKWLHLNNWRWESFEEKKTMLLD